MDRHELNKTIDTETALWYSQAWGQTKTYNYAELKTYFTKQLLPPETIMITKDFPEYLKNSLRHDLPVIILAATYGIEKVYCIHGFYARVMDIVRLGAELSNE